MRVLADVVLGCFLLTTPRARQTTKGSLRFAADSLSPKAEGPTPNTHWRCPVKANTAGRIVKILLLFLLLLFPGDLAFLPAPGFARVPLVTCFFQDQLPRTFPIRADS